MKKVILVALLLSLLLILAACTSGTREKLKVGVMLPLSGDAAAYGQPISKSYMLAVDEINAGGGIGGKQVELIFEDSKCTPNDGATAAQKLVNIDQVKIILGEACSGATLAAAPITEPAKVIVISPSATNPGISTAGDFLFRTAPSDANAGRIAADYAYEQGFRNAAIISEATDYAQGLRKVFSDTFEANGGGVVADETFTSEISDFRTTILKVRAKNPDLVYVVPQTPAKGALLVKQLNEQGVDAQLLTAEVLIADGVIAESGDDMEGIIGFEPAFDATRPKSADFVSKYRAKYNEELAFGSFQAGAYDALYLVKEAVEANNGQVDTENMRDFLYNVENWEGAVGTLTFDENGDPILSYTIKKVQDGQGRVIGSAS